MLRRQWGRRGVARIMVRGGEWHQECRDVNIGELSWAQECQKTRNNCLNKKIFVWNTLDTLQRQDHVKSSSSQMLFIFLHSQIINEFFILPGTTWRQISVRVVVFRVLIQVYTDSYCLSILTNAVMISELCNKHGQSNPSPRCRTAADQPKSHEVFMKSLPPVLSWPWICLTTKWFTKLNTMKVKTWIIIGPNNYTWHPSKLLVSGGHSFMRTRDVRQQDQEKKSDVRDYYSHSWTDGLRLKWTFLNLHLYIE